MTQIILRLAGWLAGKLGTALLIVAVVLAVGALYLFVTDHLEKEDQRTQRMEEMRGRLAEAEAAAERLREEMARIGAEVERTRARMEQAGELVRQFERLRYFWMRLVLRGEERERMEREYRRAMEEQEREAARSSRLQGDLVAADGQHQEVVGEIARLEQQIALLEADPSWVVVYTQRAWQWLKWPLVAGLLLFFLGPSLWKLLAYYVLAPQVRRFGPVRLVEGEQPWVGVGSSRVSEAVPLAPGETAWVKEKFLQASDEELRRRTRFVLDWRIPFTCAATGLIELVEMAHPGRGPARTITFSTQEEPTTELAVITVPEGGSVVLRPRYLAGVVKAAGSSLEIRRHWRIFRLQSWLTLQLRYFEFIGPCRLVVAGSRGIRGERLGPAGEGTIGAGRRTNQDSTIGFTPDLDYRSVRAETFWSYFRGMNPLFDDLFQGRGTFVCQEISVQARAAAARRFWSTLWNGIGKVFGL
ncbi:MAG: hypothetical protein EA425_06090 [Puniceicoccaceae bacterium]|nr:MAG: hypothetical protein EA425_06090 [Puniceicoccaceae bacterium]